MSADATKVYMLTPKGNVELVGANASLSADELKLLVMVDGMATVEQLARRMPGETDVAALAKRLAALARSGHIADPDASAPIDVKAFFGADIDSTLATLQAKGFAVRIARRPAAGKPAAGGKKTVLVVEDDAQLAKMLRLYLQMEDFAVRVAATRDDITKALREPPKPDVVLLDVVLPDVDGLVVLERMRAHPALKDVPIILATGKATRESVLQGLQLGADGYVTKPYDVPVLMGAIKTVLGLK